MRGWRYSNDSEQRRPWWLRPSRSAENKKKADMAEHPKAFNHVGLLVNGLPGTAELPFI
jgi:hypothetical protein